MTTALLLILPVIGILLFSAVLDALIHRSGLVLEASPAALSPVVERLPAVEHAGDERQGCLSA